MEKSTKKSFLDTLIGVKEPKMETMEHSQVLKQNLIPIIILPKQV